MRGRAMGTMKEGTEQLKTQRNRKASEESRKQSTSPALAPRVRGH
jgi:hypothetical protein